jgi:hypothetical protein
VFDQVHALDDDDGVFITAVRSVLATSLVPTREVWLVKIDQWFGSRWLQFSGKMLGAFGVWQRELTIPPFHPRRVRFERHFTLRGEHYVHTRGRTLHIWQTSAANLRKTVRGISSSAAFVWYSGDTRRADRGSLMMYQTIDGELDARYLEFARGSLGWMRRAVHDRVD